MTIRKTKLAIIGIFFLLLLSSCNVIPDGNIVLRRPTGLSCSIPTYENGAIIKWNVVENATKYYVYIDGEAVGIVRTNSFYFSYEESDLFCAKACTIQAFDDHGGMSLISSALIIPDKAPIPVQQIEFHFTVTSKLDGTWLIEWQNVYAEKYEIYISESLVASTTELSYLLSSEDVFLYNDQELTIKVIENDVKVDFIPTTYTIIAPVLVEAPVITPTNDSDGNFKVMWEEVDGAKYYNIYVDGAQYASNITDLEYTFIDSPDYTGKSIAVRSVDIYDRTSVFSNFCIYKNVLTKPEIEAYQLVSGDILVTWNEILYAEKYTIYWRNKLIDEEYISFETEELKFIFDYEKYIKCNEMYEIYLVAEKDYGEKSAESNKITWQINLDTPKIYTSKKASKFTTVIWNSVQNAVSYDVYVDGEFYGNVSTLFCEISNTTINASERKAITVVAISSQGIESAISDEYILRG